jgi:hypothetical protein
MTLFIHHNDHHSVISGQHGTTRTIKSICRYFYWPINTKNVKDYVTSCTHCQLNTRYQYFMIRIDLVIPPGRSHPITMDLAGLSSETSGEQFWIVVDRFTKRSLFEPFKQTDIAEDIASRVFDGGSGCTIWDPLTYRIVMPSSHLASDRVFATASARSWPCHQFINNKHMSRERTVKPLMEMFPSAVDFPQHA